MSSANDFVGIFLTETKGELDKISNLILGLPSVHSEDSYGELMRLLHTLKGNARMLGLQDFSEVAHIMEDCVQAISHRELEPTDAVVDFLLHGVDALNEALANLKAKKPLGIPIKAVVSQFQALKKNPHSKGALKTTFVTPQLELSMVSVPVGSMDKMMRLIEQLNVKLSAFRDLADSAIKGRINESQNFVDMLRDEILAQRMYPLSKVFSRYPRMVRELAMAQNKKINLTINCSDVKLDRSVIDVLNDPLVHILRNAVDHGIETPEVRKANKKPGSGNIEITAEKQRDYVVISVRDDGKGINKALVLGRALEMGMVSKEEAEKLGPQEIYKLIIRNGFSTKEKTTELSGRGVGLDIVYRNVKKIGGLLRIQSEEGKGTLIQLRLPLTLAIINSVFVKVGTMRFAIPLLKVSKILNYNPSFLETKGLKYFPLGALLGIQSTPSKLLIYESENGEVALGVEDIFSMEHILINKPNEQIASLPYVGGTTILGTGEVCVMLDVDSLLNRGERNGEII